MNGMQLLMRRIAPGQAGTAPRRGRLRAGFTLVELMVVVGILALLLAILIPSLSRVRSRARQIQCQSNLHQLAVAWHHYLDAAKGRYLRDQITDDLPNGLYVNITYGGKQGTNPEFSGVERPLNRYLSLPTVTVGGTGTEVFQCPGDRGPVKEWSEEEPPQELLIDSSYYDYYGTSYRTNRYLIGPKPPIPDFYDPCRDALLEAQERLSNISQSQISSESRLVLMGDFGWEDGWNNSVVEKPVEFHGHPTRRLWSSVHNIAFMDGHVAFTEIRKGLHVTGQYTVVPFRDLQFVMEKCQQVGPPS